MFLINRCGISRQKPGIIVVKGILYFSFCINSHVCVSVYVSHSSSVCAILVILHSWVCTCRVISCHRYNAQDRGHSDPHIRVAVKSEESRLVLFADTSVCACVSFVFHATIPGSWSPDLIREMLIINKVIYSMKYFKSSTGIIVV